ncbi:MAG: signal peptidase II [Bacteroidota bacterium]
MKLKGTQRTIILLLILCLNLGCDQVTKSVTRTHISYYDQLQFLNGHFTLLHVENTGAFLSLGAEMVQPFRFILLTLLPILALFGGLVYVLIKKNLGNLISVGVIFCIGGGLGNLYDRIIHGSVTDFMHIRFGALQTGIFNAADVSIMIGFGLILLDAFLKRDDGKKAEAATGVEE